MYTTVHLLCEHLTMKFYSTMTERFLLPNNASNSTFEAYVGPIPFFVVPNLTKDKSLQLYSLEVIDITLEDVNKCTLYQLKYNSVSYIYIRWDHSIANNILLIVTDILNHLRQSFIILTLPFHLHVICQILGASQILKGKNIIQISVSITTRYNWITNG